MSKFRSKKDLVPKSQLNIRVREDILNILHSLLEMTGITKTDFVEIAIIEHIMRFDNELKYEGIDFKKYLEVLKYEKLRDYTAKIRNTIMSRALFMNRVRFDILKLINFGAHLEEIKSYIDSRLTECSLYPNSELLEKEFQDYLKYSKEVNYKKLKQTIEKNMDTPTNGDSLKELEKIGKKMYLGVNGK